MTFIADKIQQLHKDMRFEFRFGMVAFKDYGEHDHIRYCPFTTRVYDLHWFLENLSSGGGSDIPDDVLGGLKAAASGMSWKGKARFCILIGDSPGHGRNLNDCRDDRLAFILRQCGNNSLGTLSTNPMD